jgi:hypothetical protein
MPHPFDATLKDLGANSPEGFLTLFDAPPEGPVKLLTPDLSTVTTATDLVLGLGDPPVEIVHYDFQSSADADKGRDVLVYHALLHRFYKVPVHSVLILLHPRAVLKEVSGAISYAPRRGRGKMDFGYEVVRLWKVPAEDLMREAVGVAPLAILGELPQADDERDALADIADRIWQRIAAEAPPGHAARLRVSLAELMSLRVKRNVVRDIIMGIPSVTESEGVLVFKEMGAEIQLKKSILRLDRKRLGQEDEAAHKRLDTERDLERLERYFGRLVDDPPPSWADLLDTP